MFPKHFKKAIEYLFIMLVVVASSGESLSDLVDSRFGRCPFFIIAEVNDGIRFVKAVSNPGFSADRGAGLSAAQLVINLNADAVIARSVGPRARELLDKFNVNVFVGEGVVRRVLERFRNNELVML